MPKLSHFFLLLFSLLLSQRIFAQIPPPPPPPDQPQSPFIACKSTLYPKLCRSILSSFQHSPKNPDAYGKFSVEQCLKQSQTLYKLIDHLLSRQKQSRNLSIKEVNALHDCSQLSELTVDYLESIATDLKSVNSTTSTSDSLVGRVQALLSAVVTNQQTCYDGLVDSGSSVVGALIAPLADASQLYSVSLGLVMHALGRVRKARKRSRLSVDRGLLELDWTRKSSAKLTRVLHGSNDPRSWGRNLAELVDKGVNISEAVTVSPYGGSNFTSIGDAIAFAPENLRTEDGYFAIYVKQGYYEEYVVVPKHKQNIMLIGDGINRTVISGNRSVIDGWTTFNSSTFAVSGERFVAIGITFMNIAGPEKHQAVAVRNSADLSTFYRCSFEGYQDTLYVHSLRQFYRECDIYGTVDFIFGNSAAVFQNCNLFARKPMPNQKIALTAQGRTDPNQTTGISIQNCTIQAALDLSMDLNSALSYLGRPWKEYSRTVVMQSFIGDLINPQGWLEWNATMGLDKIYYGEYENYGPGANTSMRVQWPGYSHMTYSEALNFTVYNFTMGDTWLPYTNVPFYGGLYQ